MFKKIFKFIFSHKIFSLILAVLILAAGYFGFNFLNKNKIAEASYVVAAVERGTLISSVSGTGQVSSSSQVDIKPKASGDIVYLSAKAGQKVSAGTLLAKIDTTDAEKSIRDAQAALDSANLSLEKLKQPASELSVLQAEDALAQAEQSKNSAEESLNKAYDDGFNSVANAFLELPSIMSGLNDILYGKTFSQSQGNADYYGDSVKNYDEKILQYKQDAFDKYYSARQMYDKNFEDYKNTDRYSSPAAIEALIGETYDSVKSIAEATKSANNLVQFYKDLLIARNIRPSAVADTHLSSLDSYTGTTNGFLSSLLSIKQTIQNSKNSSINTARTIIEKQKSLEELMNGADALDIQSQELSIKQKENALADAKANLAKYYIYAPFSGTIASVDMKKGDSASSGTAIATIITDSQIAEITLNEVDVAKVKVGQKATLAFDAVSDLNIAGEVAEVDSIGTASQGVVSYAVKINFDTQSELIKPGMSVSASIITDAKEGLLVSNSAIKTSGGVNYVEMPSEKVADDKLNNNGGISLSNVTQQVVEIGSSNDTYTEITSGLSEGDQIVLKTITATAKTNSQSQGQSLLQFGTGSNRSTTQTTTTNNANTKSTNMDFGPPPN
ncbi:MAG: efflux RND transporter periplasmic adaptor subunit [Candidatus Paceibacterota bacterium]